MEALHVWGRGCTGNLCVLLHFAVNLKRLSKTKSHSPFFFFKYWLGITLEVIHTYLLILEDVLRLNYFFHYKKVLSFQDNEKEVKRTP